MTYTFSATSITGEWLFTSVSLRCMHVQNATAYTIRISKWNTAGKCNPQEPTAAPNFGKKTSTPDQVEKLMQRTDDRKPMGLKSGINIALCFKRMVLAVAFHSSISPKRHNVLVT